MGLRFNKYYFEKKFFDNWTYTLVQYAGQEFKTDGLTQWINPIYRPASISPYGIGASEMHKGTLDVICWAKNNTQALHLADLVIEFMQENIEPDIFKLDRYEIQDMYWDDSGYHYVYITFSVRLYDLKCTPTVKNNSCLYEGTDGTKYGFKLNEFGAFSPPTTIDGKAITEMSWQNDGTFIVSFSSQLGGNVDKLYLTHEYSMIELYWDGNVYTGKHLAAANELIYRFVDGGEVCMCVESSLPDMFIEYIF